MKAIEVKYLSPTNTKGSRLKAFIKGISITEQLNYGIESNRQSLSLAKKLAKKLNWDVKISGSGMLSNGNHVFTLK